MIQVQSLYKTIELASEALQANTYPIGAMITSRDGHILSSSHNRSFIDNDATAHAEILAIRAAGTSVMPSFSQAATILYTSLEPCLGCFFFLRYTNIKTVVCALKDPLKGGVQSLKSLAHFSADFHNIEVIFEPDQDLKLATQELLHTYFIQNNRPNIAKHYE